MASFQIQFTINSENISEAINITIVFIVKMTFYDDEL